MLPRPLHRRLGMHPSLDFSKLRDVSSRHQRRFVPILFVVRERFSPPSEVRVVGALGDWEDRYTAPRWRAAAKEVSVCF